MNSIYIVIIIVVLIIIWVISVQNNLVKLDELCKNSLRQINVQQISRFDAIKTLVKLVKEYAEVKANNLAKVIEARKLTSSPNPSPKDVASNENFLQQTVEKLLEISEQYHELKSNESFNTAMNSIKEYEENVRKSRIVYNDSVTAFNNKVRMFPFNLVAAMLGFPVREFLHEDTTRIEYPEI